MTLAEISFLSLISSSPLVPSPLTSLLFASLLFAYLLFAFRHFQMIVAGAIRCRSGA